MQAIAPEWTKIWPRRRQGAKQGGFRTEAERDYACKVKQNRKRARAEKATQERQRKAAQRKLNEEKIARQKPEVDRIIVRAIESRISELKLKNHGRKAIERQKSRYDVRQVKRRYKVLVATPKWANRKAIAAIYLRAKMLTRATGTLWVVDHTVPLQSALVCGLHCEANLQVIPRTENTDKSNTSWPDMP